MSDLLAKFDRVRDEVLPPIREEAGLPGEAEDDDGAEPEVYVRYTEELESALIATHVVHRDLRAGQSPALSQEQRERIGGLLELVDDPTDDRGELDFERAGKVLERSVETTEDAATVALEAARILINTYVRDLAAGGERP